MAHNTNVTADGGLRGWWIAAAILVLITVGAATIPSPYAIERPGPVVDAFGSIDTEEGETPVISVEGVETFPTSGTINILSVTISGSPDRPLAWLALARTWFDPTQSVVPLSALFPEGISAEERAAANAQLMETSQLQATAAALGQLGQPLAGEVRVRSVVDGGPAAGILEQGDTILAAGDREIGGLGELQAALSEAGSGGQLTLDIARGGNDLRVVVSPQARGSDPQPLLGVTVTTELEIPFDVEFQLDKIGGPSAGLTFALALYDLLTPGELTGGLTVSTTGTIDELGTVGPIGGVPQKLWGAANAGTDLILLPLANCMDLPESLPAGVPIVPVATLTEAITAIDAVKAGETPAGLERCEAPV